MNKHDFLIGIILVATGALVATPAFGMGKRPMTSNVCLAAEQLRLSGNDLALIRMKMNKVTPVSPMTAYCLKLGAISLAAKHTKQEAAGTKWESMANSIFDTVQVLTNECDENQTRNFREVELRNTENTSDLAFSIMQLLESSCPADK
ncbi:MAG TPA: hypothetical protein DCS07_02040 [Bdellovibrionales bacterium]|nr:hypothetical protein [Bdellovibrionales bacterium]HCM38926.1 hypothetical protein [Bdellovibrionales bacterium]